MFNTALLQGQPALARHLAGKSGLSHAYILSGGSEEGRDACARLLTQALLCTAPAGVPCQTCAGCRKAVGGTHPDVMSVAPAEGKRDLTVDQIRALRADAFIRPNEAPRKVYRINRAESMNQSAQNALLKVLEEGPAYACFLLLTENSGMLLPTVRSRCEQLSLLPEHPDAPIDSPQAAALAQALLKGDELELLALCVELEKLERDAFASLLEETRLLLVRRMRQTPRLQRDALPVVALLQELRESCRFYVGTGHLCGRLCAARFI